MGRIQPVTLNFLCLVSEKGRIRFLPEICAKFKELYEKHNNIIEVTAVTAMPLSERLRNKLVAKLGGFFGGKDSACGKGGQKPYGRYRAEIFRHRNRRQRQN